MTSLACNVTTCASNRDGFCCQSAIKVQGTGAKRAERTCCQSFFRKGDGEVSSRTHYEVPNPELDVYCMANLCRHNDQHHRCTADHIDIAGDEARLMNETMCATYEAE